MWTVRNGLKLNGIIVCVLMLVPYTPTCWLFMGVSMKKISILVRFILFLWILVRWGSPKLWIWVVRIGKIQGLPFIRLWIHMRLSRILKLKFKLMALFPTAGSAQMGLSVGMWACLNWILEGNRISAIANQKLRIAMAGKSWHLKELSLKLDTTTVWPCSTKRAYVW